MIPCEKCILLPICKNRYLNAVDKYFEKYRSRQLRMSYLLVELSKQCELFHSWLTHQIPENINNPNLIFAHAVLEHIICKHKEPKLFVDLIVNYDSSEVVFS